MLTHKQLRFIEEYLKNPANATAAAIAAGYPVKAAAQQASRLLKNAKIAAKIEEQQRQNEHFAGINRAQVLKEIALIAFSDVTKITVDELGKVAVADGQDPAILRAISSVKYRRNAAGIVTTEVKLWDKNAALRALCQHLGLLSEPQAEAGKGVTTVHVYVPANGRDPTPSETGSVSLDPG